MSGYKGDLLCRLDQDSNACDCTEEERPKFSALIAKTRIDIHNHYTKMLKVVAPVLLATLVAGHGHVTNIVVNGVSYQGWDINSFPYSSDPPTVVAWGTPNTGNGFISPG
jgi:hypothetical protein